MTVRINANSETTVTVTVPLAVRARNGRPKLVLPATADDESASGPDPTLLRAIARAWLWRRRLETGEVGTIDDIAREEGVTGPYVGRILRLAYLAPLLVEHLLSGSAARGASYLELKKIADQPWAGQQLHSR